MSKKKKHEKVEPVEQIFEAVENTDIDNQENVQDLENRTNEGIDSSGAIPERNDEAEIDSNNSGSSDTVTTENQIEEPETAETPQQAEPLEKEKKPRKKREKKIKEPDIFEPVTMQEDEFAQLEDEMSKAQSVQAPTTKQKKTKPIEGLITGYIVLYVCDIVFPLAIAYVSKSFFKLNLPSKALKLTSDQWHRLEPIADEAIKGMVVEIKPQYALVILLGLSYLENATIYLQLNSEQDVNNIKRRKTTNRKNNKK